MPPKLVIAHHIAPLIVLIGYSVLFVWQIVYTTLTYFHLPFDQRTAITTAFVGGTQTVLAGLAGLVFRFYVGAKMGDDRGS